MTDEKKEEMTETLICAHCGVEMEMRKVTFHYLGHDLSTEASCCPVCKQVYIPEDLVRGRIASVEEQLEDK